MSCGKATLYLQISQLLVAIPGVSSPRAPGATAGDLENGASFGRRHYQDSRGLSGQACCWGKSKKLREV